MSPETQLAMAQAERDAFKKDAATISIMVSRLESDCATLRATLNVTEEKLKEALRDRDQWRQSYDTTTANFIEAKDRLGDERDRLRVALKEATGRDGGWQAMYDKVSAELHITKCQLADAVARAAEAQEERARVCASKDAQIKKLSDALAECSDAYDARNAAEQKTTMLETVVAELGQERDAAERERDALRSQLSDAYRVRDAAVTARVFAETEGMKSLGFMGFVGRVYDCPHEEGESIDQWGNRLTVAIHEDADKSLGTPCPAPDCVPNDEHQRVVNEVATLDALCKLHLKHAAEHAAATDVERAAHESTRRRLSALEAISHAFISAIARG